MPNIYHACESNGPAHVSTEQALYTLEALIDSLPNGNVRVKLFAQDIVPLNDVTLAELDAAEADFTSYAAEDVVPAAVGTDGDGNAVALLPQAAFAAADDAAPNQVYGYYLTTDDDASLLGAGRFENAPIGILDNGDSITVTAALKVSIS